MAGAELAAALPGTVSVAAPAAVLTFDGAVVEQPPRANASPMRPAAIRIPRLRVGDIYTSTDTNFFIYISTVPSITYIRSGHVEDFCVENLDTTLRTAPSTDRFCHAGLRGSWHMGRRVTVDPRRRYKMSHRSLPYDGWHGGCLYICRNGPIGRGRKQQRRNSPFDIKTSDIKRRGTRSFMDAPEPDKKQNNCSSKASKQATR